MTDIENAPQDSGVVPEQQPTPEKPDLLREAGRMTISDWGNMLGEPYMLTEDYAAATLLGPQRREAESEEK
jgi:hypothetical protein